MSRVFRCILTIFFALVWVFDHNICDRSSWARAMGYDSEDRAVGEQRRLLGPSGVPEMGTCVRRHPSEFDC